jgi:hypothetical protein
MTMQKRYAAAALSVIGGATIGLLDSSPGWDDTAITAGLLFSVALAATLIGGRRALVWALMVGAWVPLLEIPVAHDPAPLAAIVFAGAGAGTARVLARKPAPGVRPV